jgi:hypothetical protein
VGSKVQIFPGPHALDPRGVSSAGRAPALQAGGQGFDPLTLHDEVPQHRGSVEGFFFGILTNVGLDASLTDLRPSLKLGPVSEKRISVNDAKACLEC